VIIRNHQTTFDNPPSKRATVQKKLDTLVEKANMGVYSITHQLAIENKEVAWETVMAPFTRFTSLTAGGGDYSPDATL
jgi:hypothetical protein